MIIASRAGLSQTLVWFGVAILVLAAIFADCAKAERRRAARRVKTNDKYPSRYPFSRQLAQFRGLFSGSWSWADWRATGARRLALNVPRYR